MLSPGVYVKERISVFCGECQELYLIVLKYPLGMPSSVSCRVDVTAPLRQPVTTYSHIVWGVIVGWRPCHVSVATGATAQTRRLNVCHTTHTWTGAGAPLSLLMSLFNHTLKRGNNSHDILKLSRRWIIVCREYVYLNVFLFRLWIVICAVVLVNQRERERESAVNWYYVLMQCEKSIMT